MGRLVGAPGGHRWLFCSLKADTTGPPHDLAEWAGSSADVRAALGAPGAAPRAARRVPAPGSSSDCTQASRAAGLGHRPGPVTSVRPSHGTLRRPARPNPASLAGPSVSGETMAPRGAEGSMGQGRVAGGCARGPTPGDSRHPAAGPRQEAGSRRRRDVYSDFMQHSALEARAARSPRGHEAKAGQRQPSPAGPMAVRYPQSRNVGGEVTVSSVRTGQEPRP